MYDRNTLSRVKDMNRMTRVTYLSSYLEWVSHQDFKNVAYVGFFRHFLCVFVFVVVFVIVFVFVFVSSYDFWIAFIISFQNMYGYRGLWGLRADIMIIFEVMTDTKTHTQTPIPLIDSAHPVGWAEWKEMQPNFPKMRGGREWPKAVWNFCENSSDLVSGPFP